MTRPWPPASPASAGHGEAILPVTADAVGEALTLLEGDPEPGHGLVGRLLGLSSLRVGAYRIVYERRDRGKTTRVLVIRHRSIAYSRDPR